jgi:hypothetical protein
MFRTTIDMTCACRNCPGGHYNSGAATITEGRIDCDACPAGRFASDVGANMECTTCEAGKFTDERVGSAFCQHCSPGTHGVTNDDVPTCTACAAGRYQPYPGKKTCDVCTCGKYTTLTGRNQCETCDYSSAQESTCSGSCAAELPELPPLPAFSFVDFATTDLTIGACQDNLQDAQAGLQELTGGVTTQRENLDTTSVELITTLTDLTTCQTDLGTKTTELDTCYSDLGTTTSELGTCDSDLGTTTSELGTKTAQFGACSTTLKTKATDLASCNTSLVTTSSGLAACTRELDSVDAATTTSGLVHIDINHDGSVDTLDAMTLFVAQTMQNFGAVRVLTRTYQNLAWSGDRSIEQIIAEVSIAVDAASAV